MTPTKHFEQNMELLTELLELLRKYDCDAGFSLDNMPSLQINHDGKTSYNRMYVEETITITLLAIKS